MHAPKVVEIKRIIEETDTIKTFIFNWDGEPAKPGQFMMLWNFHDEKPMSISLIDPIKEEIGISIKNIGPFTEAIHSLQVGDKLGLRGPYGRGFEITGSKILAVGGGVGMAPISAFVNEARDRGVDVDVISAATTKNELLFMDELRAADVKTYACTDDGSFGFCGFATEFMEEIIKEKDYDMVVTCGPEIMMKGVFEIVDKLKIPAQFSMERYMKCGIGICGQCCVDDTGWRICAEGPVFWTDEVRLITEFGKYKRDASGIKHDI
ncbi:MULTISPECIES: dihydroorotate dehydrogenase electron transfer subunit [Methanobacterium]|jgi:dihydroorotate dehydrogenase electron transfer subunit|uniref:Probable dihydroorotate dehydrogenase B (NAD(+)), electron transfer subunit n=1 Tax=Methanobacterium bryantii TaxID=2161 RepID=A0A2A2H6S3_METBR|nr:MULTISPECIES: dihydroorotate dehydrogenase electron transfer subunit [Methanobacterium]OEC84960.1 dihydroorotate dehydrogenase electron transfer subunit [Methanobacterium sp. A39]PAV05109.1 dihydroorotate dehydrogenase [Methanobacterium bryantii]